MIDACTLVSRLLPHAEGRVHGVHDDPERHTKWQNHTKSNPDGEDNLDVYYSKNLVSTLILLSTLWYAS